MAIKTIDCVDCGASVLYGRLSCPNCGALLASVAGSHRGALRIVESEPDARNDSHAEPEVSSLDADPEPAPAPVTVQAHVRARPRITPRRPRIVATSIAAAELPLDPEPPAAESESVIAIDPPIAVGADMALAAEPMGEAEPAVAAATEPQPAPEPIRESVEPERDPAAGRFGVRPVSQSAARTPWAPLREPAPTLVARPYQRHISFETETSTEPSPLPGAYVPPTAAATTHVSAATPRWPSASAMGANAAVSATAIPRADPAPAVSMKRGVEAATFVEIAGWFVIVGATMSVLGFLLPWSVSVIGAHGVGGYFNGWGLASPTHVFVFAGLLVVLALGIMRTRVPGWLSTGVLGLVVGGLLVGLVWPYIVGPLGADVGVTVTALGGLALVIGGALASWATRHGAADPGV